MQCHFYLREDGHNIHNSFRKKRGRGAPAHRVPDFMALVEVVPSGSCWVPKSGLENLVNPPVPGLYTHRMHPNIDEIDAVFSNGGDLRIAELRFRVCECVRNMNQLELYMSITNLNMRNNRLLIDQ